MGRRPPTVFLYTDYSSESLDTDVIAEHLNWLGIPTVKRGDLFQFLGNSEACRRIAGLMARSRVADIGEPLDALLPESPADADSELRKMTGCESVRGEFYDGLWLQRILHRALADKAPGEPDGLSVHMVFTGRLFGTYGERRYHARVILTGSPALISTSGLVEAPARPGEYYFIKGGLLRSGGDISELDRMYKGRYVEYDDPRTSPIMCSYALQAVYYELIGNEFCGDAGCCLYNSHWQEEVLRIQYEGNMCKKCVEELKEFLILGKG
ncbi:MAG TPA: DUF6775 family putative metallopeptidase [Thermodesulfobacteriota bacterium]|nr:DUF6775 family putative metallopeptidase [Thermodesulfobacteriota bacterium]